MQKSNHQRNYSASNKRPKLEFNSKHVKGKNKHARRQTELTGMAKTNQDGVINDGISPKPDAFIENSLHNRTKRRPNFNFEKTLDFIGIGGTNMQNSQTNEANLNNNGFSEYFRTMNVNLNQQNNNFSTAAEAMGIDGSAGLQKSNSISNYLKNNVTHRHHPTSSMLPRTGTFDQKSHSRHNSASISKSRKKFETEIEHKGEDFEAGGMKFGQTFDEGNRHRNMPIYNSYDNSEMRHTNQRNNSISFNFKGNPFYFRRTISKIPTFMDRQKLTRQMSISKNVEKIRRQSSVNITTCRICMCQIVDILEEATFPCSCQGSIKYVHTICIQEWIKTSGAIECEICHQMYSEEWVSWAIEHDYVKKDAVEEEEEVLEDIIDKYCDKLKYLFMFMILVFILYFVIFFIMRKNMPEKTDNDIIFLIWRWFILLWVVTIILLVFFWAKVLSNDYIRRFKLSIIIRKRLSEINAFPLLTEIEGHRDNIREFYQELKQREPPTNIIVVQNLSELVPSNPRGN